MSAAAAVAAAPGESLSNVASPNCLSSSSSASASASAVVATTDDAAAVAASSSSASLGAAAAASAAPAVAPARSGGVGAGLATSAWWCHYYSQQHDNFWDWYLPNEVVVEELQRQARVQARIREPESNTDTDDADADAEAQQQEDDKDAGSTQTAASSSSSAAAAAAVVDAWVFADSAEAQLRLARLPCLQLGCGNSEVTALLWEECGLRSLHNVDFSPACIERMQSLQKERGWITDPAIAAAAASDAVAAVSSAGSTAAAAAADVLSIASTVGAGFTFRVMDVRALQYPSNCFSLVFDKGTLDCVSLESSGDSAPGESSRAMLREIWRVLRPGGVCVCFSLYPPSARGLFFLAAAGESGESDAELTEWAEEVLSADNPPQVLRDTAAWSELRMQPLDISPLELPNQQHTYLYVAVKR